MKHERVGVSRWNITEDDGEAVRAQVRRPYSEEDGWVSNDSLITVVQIEPESDHSAILECPLTLRQARDLRDALTEAINLPATVQKGER